MINEEENSKLVPYENQKLMKSNLLIGAKYKASLTELRITYAALYRIQNLDYKDEPEGIVVELNGAELKELLNVKGNGIYDTLEPIAKAMSGHSMGMSDPETQSFDYIALITRATYKDGIFRVTFNSALRDYVVNLQSNFTNLDRITMMSFKSAYTFRLYELLKKQCYYPKTYTGKRDNVFRIEIGLSELKLELGVVNAEFESVKKELVKGDKPDYDKAVEKAPEKIASYSIWNNFKNRCLDKAVTEINAADNSDLYIEYKPKRGGRGGKIRAIDFTVYLNGAQNNDSEQDVIPVALNKDGSIEPNLDATEKFYFYADVMSLFEKEKIQIGDAMAIAEAAAFDMDKIKRQHSLMNMQRNRIENVTGWMITALREQYEVVGQEPRKKTGFENFESRNYDLDALEKALLSGESTDF